MQDCLAILTGFLLYTSSPDFITKVKANLHASCGAFTTNILIDIQLGSQGTQHYAAIS